MAVRWTRWVRRTALSNLLAAALGALLAFGLLHARQMNVQQTPAAPALVRTPHAPSLEATLVLHILQRAEQGTAIRSASVCRYIRLRRRQQQRPCAA